MYVHIVWCGGMQARLRGAHLALGPRCALGGTRVRSLPVMLPELVHLSKLDMDVERMQFPPPETCALGLCAV